MPKIEFVELKNPTWHIGDVYWTEKPDAHFRCRVVYEWKDAAMGFRGTSIVFIPENVYRGSIVDALNSLCNGNVYRLIDVEVLTPEQIAKWNGEELA